MFSPFVVLSELASAKLVLLCQEPAALLHATRGHKKLLK